MHFSLTSAFVEVCPQALCCVSFPSISIFKCSFSFLIFFSSGLFLRVLGVDWLLFIFFQSCEIIAENELFVFCLLVCFWGWFCLFVCFYLDAVRLLWGVLAHSCGI